MAAGGSFMDGAQTAAFGYLFNCVAHQCWIQAAKGVLKVVGGSVAAATGASICSTTGVGCLAGVPMVLFGASDATQGITMTYDAYVGLTSEGWNPIKQYLSDNWGVKGAAGYEFASAAVNLTSFAAKVPMAGSIFGVTVTRWNNPVFMKVFVGQKFQNLGRATMGAGVASKVYSGVQETQK